MTPFRDAPRRVPEPTPSFWVIKVLTTGMGEALSDFLVTRFDPAPTVVITAAVFGAVLIAQFRTRRYRPWMYWSAVCMVGVFGTMVADVAHVAAGIPYIASTPVFLVALAVVILTWRRTEGTIDVHTITTTRREGFYWAAVIATFATGTAAGDLTAATLHLGYLASGLVFTTGMAIVVVLRLTRLLGPIAAFWSAYVLTRPIGASFADWLAVPHARGGLGYGTGLVSAIALIAIIAAVAHTAARRGSRSVLASDR
jgi:uncharacterized membrane-anchored protein